MGPERGFRAGSKGRQGGLSQRRGLGPQLPFGRGASGIHKLAVASGPALLQQGSPGAWLQLPRWSRGQGVKTRSPQRSLFLGAWPTVLGTKKHKFPTFPPPPRPTLHVWKPTQLPSSSKNTPLLPNPSLHRDICHNTGQESNPSRALSDFVASNTPVPTTLSAFQRRPDTHLESPLPRRPPAGRPNRLFMPTSRQGGILIGGRAQTKRPGTDRRPEEKGEREEK